jgi:hypothetical protein
MRRALAIDQRRYGIDHREVASCLNNLARLLEDTNRLAEAEPLSRRAVDILLKFTRRTQDLLPRLQLILANYWAILKAVGRTEADIEAELQKLMAEKP